MYTVSLSGSSDVTTQVTIDEIKCHALGSILLLLLLGSGHIQPLTGQSTYGACTNRARPVQCVLVGKMHIHSSTYNKHK